MAIAGIHDWLQSKGTFALGVQLLGQHGKLSKAEEFFFSLPESPVNRQRLVASLSKLSEAATSKQKARDKEVIAQVAVVSEYDRLAFERTLSSEPPTDLPVESLPVELRSLRKDMVSIHTEMTLLRGEMSRTPDGWELAAITKKILALDRHNVNGWRRIEYWRETGKFLDDETPALVVEDKAHALKRRNAVRVWLSQRSPDAVNPRSFTPEQHTAKKKELEELNTLIDGPGIDQ